KQHSWRRGRQATPAGQREWIRLWRSALHAYGAPSPLRARRTTLPAFEMDETEVTKAAYRACMDASACDKPPLGVKDLGANVSSGPRPAIATQRRAFATRTAASFAARTSLRLPIPVRTWE